MYKSAFITLFLFSNYIISLSLGNKLSFYVHKRYVPFITASALFCLLVLFVIFLFRKYIHNHTSFKKTDVIVILIIIIAIIVPPKPLTSITAKQRGLMKNEKKEFSTQMISTNTQVEKPIKEHARQTTLKQLQEAKLSGFVSSGKLFSKEDKYDEFYITRFVVSCCTADATPTGVKVKYDWKDKLKEDEWIEIKGFITRIIDSTGTIEPVLIPTSINKIPIPTDPYLYELFKCNLLAFNFTLCYIYFRCK